MSGKLEMNWHLFIFYFNRSPGLKQSDQAAPFETKRGGSVPRSRTFPYFKILTGIFIQPRHGFPQHPHFNSRSNCSMKEILPSLFSNHTCWYFTARRTPSLSVYRSMAYNSTQSSPLSVLFTDISTSISVVKEVNDLLYVSNAANTLSRPPLTLSFGNRMDTFSAKMSLEPDRVIFSKFLTKPITLSPFSGSMNVNLARSTSLDEEYHEKLQLTAIQPMYFKVPHARLVK